MLQKYDESKPLGPLDIIFENDELIAINKPPGLLVHRSKIANDATEFALQLLRDQIDQHVHLAHRLDRKTSGVLLFAKSRASNAQLQALFRTRKITKRYQAIVRGFVPSAGTIDYTLREGSKVQDAQTVFTLLQKFELEIPSGKFLSTRYSLVELNPVTGRYHQLRKHMAHIFHPIIGDRPHGCNKQNKIWKERFRMTNMLLHADCLAFNYPASNPIVITAPLSVEFARSLQILKAGNCYAESVNPGNKLN